MRTPDNFGRLGERPTDPELLDYLAKRFVESGWSIKKMHRMIMLSKTYQMSAAFDEATKCEGSGESPALALPAQRLSVEEIRDAYSPWAAISISPWAARSTPASAPMARPAPDRISMNPEKTNRRSIYLPLRRSNLPTLSTCSISAMPPRPTEGRIPTTVATQALFVMNSPLRRRTSRERAKLESSEAGDRRRMVDAYLRVLDRRRPKTRSG